MKNQKLLKVKVKILLSSDLGNPHFLYQILLLKNHLVLIARIEEVGSEMGEPDCKLIEPYELKQENGQNFLTSWPSFTTQKELMIHSDSILTMVQPDKDQLDKYQTLTAKPSITVK